MIEVDGNYHFYSERDPVPTLATQFKYRLMDLYKVPYLRIECWSHLKVKNEKK